MVVKLKITMIYIACVLIVGCAGTNKDFVSLTEATKQRIASSEFILVKNQEELNAEVDTSKISEATGGLLIALIDVAITNSRANEAEKLLAPIRNALIDFDMHKEIKHTVFPVIQSTPWLHATDIVVIPGNYQDIVNKTLKDQSIKADVIGAISSNYTLDSNFNTLKVESVLELYPLHPDFKNIKFDEKKSKKQEQLQPIYRTKVVYNKKLEATTSRAKENAKLLAANGGQTIKVALKDAIANIASQLKERLHNPCLDQNIKN